MKCKKVLERIDDHVDGLLPAPEAEAIRDHFDLCSDCRETALAVKAATASLSTWGDVDPPAACFDEILARIGTLPAEVLEHRAPRGFFARVPQFALPHWPRFDDGRVTHVRRYATTGLAAAAAVLAALVISKSEPRTARRPHESVVAGSFARQPLVNAAQPLFQGYDLDDGLYRYGANPAKPVRALVPQLEPSPR
jgi:anti-sigma factor RsiW